ncbi:response regulator [Desulfobulbus rhabdoformis]|uniref:hybrid sensor histidine kinase/response regulator n=1 Tax=Desulfobulbus rhabdoformis TaxID=34032 RepID=UPI001962C883|nr:ATP-binding protein [Desulfobulbus rhabdoformis]MBM9615868.1 response regulator [Desulfobulbus rhabdoformis]
MFNRKQKVEKQIHDNEEKYRLLVDNANDAIFIVQDEVIKFSNPKTENIIGYSAEEMAQISFEGLIYQDDRELVLEWYKRRLRGEKAASSCSFQIISKTDARLWVEVNTVLLDWENRPATLNFLRDITAQKKLEAQLQRSQKMEAIGTLAGGVAHDLNNILSGIVGYPDILLMQIPKDSPLIKPIIAMRDSGVKAASIVQDLLTLTRMGIATPVVANINRIISEYLESPEYEKLKFYHPQIDVKINLDVNLLNTRCSTVHLSKVIMNLVINAVEAIPNEGTIILSTENRYIDRPISGYDSIEEGEYVALAVSDTGIGISSEDMEKIFEPFFTKKTMGKSGTGLGMSVVWSTVKDHKGYIDIESTEGKGTKITLYFPATRERVAQEKSSLSIAEYMGDGKSILVVDDLKEQRELAHCMLTKLGYTADTASSGEEAIKYLKDKSADLILLDMIMEPGIDGLETYKKILEVRPGQKAIIASGFSETERVREAQRLGAGQYIKKPYTLEKLGAAVKKEFVP